MTNGFVVMSALVRAACLRLSLDGARSTVARGHTSVLAAAGGSNLWCETVDSRRWRITLGAAKPDDMIAADWQLDVEWAGGDLATLCTPIYLTHDGTLANGDVHDQLRDALSDAFTRGDADAERLEVSLTGASFDWLCRLPERTQDVFDGHVRIRTRLSLETVARELRDVALPLVEHAGNRWVWSLGLDDGTLDLVATTDGGTTHLRGNIALAESLSPMRRTTAERAAQTWCRYAERYLRILDPEVRFERVPAQGEAR